ncbi:GYD domain-containing protein [Solirhodobacter olei]|uniref:GYD domain-containing protein n=1 Tax=Solirhodobacter olei TaxID=2493082 RepID=UPI000FD844CC|nr:GYD domain-containing protein [Solirhodobacter olei]
MAFYLYQLSYTPEAMKAMISHPSDRRAAAEKIISAVGGKLHNMFFAMGTWDVICLIEGKDDMSAAASAMVVGASGTVASASTVKLLTMEEAAAAMKLAHSVAASYKAPMN